MEGREFLYIQKKQSAKKKNTFVLVYENSEISWIRPKKYFQNKRLKRLLALFAQVIKKWALSTTFRPA